MRGERGRKRETGVVFLATCTHTHTHTQGREREEKSDRGFLATCSSRPAKMSRISDGLASPWEGGWKVVMWGSGRGGKVVMWGSGRI